MYDNVVDVPRLLHNYGVGEQLPHPALERGPGRAERALPAGAAESRS